MLQLYRAHFKWHKRLNHFVREEGFVDTDFLLVMKMKQGDEEAFDKFVRKYYGEIHV